jgi:peptidoglycan/LPS O-acetylase OafA/YrhL
MTAGLSLYLDLVRFAAALMVFLVHLGYGPLVGGAFGNFNQFGTPAVLVFFVLSGFVISHVRASREQTLVAYTVARISRLYSVALPALVLTAVFDSIGRLARPDLYPIGLSAMAFLRCLTFTNALWGGGYPFGSTVTYWSLGFEVPYYMLFATVAFARGWTRLMLFALVAGVAGPEIMAMFPAWLLGCGCHALCRREWRMGALAWPLFMLPAAGFAVLVWHGALQPIALGFGFTARPLLLAYAVALLFAAHLIGARCVSDWLGRALSPLAGPIRWVANTTFTLYLLHLPLAFLLRSLLPEGARPWQAAAVLLPGVLAATFLVAEFTEKRKSAWRKVCERLVSAAKNHRSPPIRLGCKAQPD